MSKNYMVERRINDLRETGLLQPEDVRLYRRIFNKVDHLRFDEGVDLFEKKGAQNFFEATVITAGEQFEGKKWEISSSWLDYAATLGRRKEGDPAVTRVVEAEVVCLKTWFASEHLENFRALLTYEGRRSLAEIEYPEQSGRKEW